MNRHINYLMITLLVIIGEMLLFSCVAKTTGPSTLGNIFEQVEACDWCVYLNYDEYDVDNIAYSHTLVRYYAHTQLSVIPTVSININGTNLVLYNFFDDSNFDDDVTYFWYFTNPIPITSDTLYTIALTVNGNTSSASLEIPYHPSINYAPEIFNHTQAMIFAWELNKNANYQMIAYDLYDNYQEFFINIPISTSDRQYVIQPNTIQATWESIDIFVVVQDIKIEGNIAFIAERSDDRAYFASGYSSRVVKEFSSNNYKR